MSKVNIIGAGLSGLSAAIHLAQMGVGCRLVSVQASERAQSVLAEGGINAALGEGDTVADHFNDTLKGGAYLADPEAVRALTDNAPDTVKWLISLGAALNLKDGAPVLRSFGGQKNKRTAYAKSSTGKVIMTALIDEARKYEKRGLIKRCCHHEAIGLDISGGVCTGVRVRDNFTHKLADFEGAVLLCCGGLGGFFPNMTTGTTQNTGTLAANAFARGVKFTNLEMIQYHPTTIGISGKRLLVSEAARGEGGKLFINRNGERWYFMEEKYPTLGSLMPRDIVAREMFNVRGLPECEKQVYLDLSLISEDTWQTKLSDMHAELKSYLGLDARRDPIPVKEGIHYFMGGIDTDKDHRTNIKNLYAAGECTSRYHGANRLGGNSMLGAVFGGSVAARALAGLGLEDTPEPVFAEDNDTLSKGPSAELTQRVGDILLSALGIVRNEKGLATALGELEKLNAKCESDRQRLVLARAMLLSALARKESRGAHFRSDFPTTDDSYKRPTAAVFEGEVKITI